MFCPPALQFNLYRIIADRDCVAWLQSYKPDAKDWLSSYWKGFMGPDQLARIRNTGVPKEFLRDVGTSISTIPDGFNPHRMIKKVFEQRRGMVEEREDVDWGMAELLAFGTLLAEGGEIQPAQLPPTPPLSGGFLPPPSVGHSGCMWGAVNWGMAELPVNLAITLALQAIPCMAVNASGPAALLIQGDMIHCDSLQVRGWLHWHGSPDALHRRPYL